MRVSAPVLVAIGAVAVLVVIGITDQVLPATDARLADVRPWIAARAVGVMAYLLLALEVATGLVLSHPRNAASWPRRSRSSRGTRCSRCSRSGSSPSTGGCSRWTG